MVSLSGAGELQTLTEHDNAHSRKVDLLAAIVSILLDEALKSNTFESDTRTQLLLLGAELAQAGTGYMLSDEEAADDEEDDEDDRTGKRPAAITREEAEARYAARYDDLDDEDEGEDDLDEDDDDLDDDDDDLDFLR